MDARVCVNCRNEKAVNLTSNRLVTESCGHVKCMSCLLQENSGCLACTREKADLEDGLEPEVGLAVEDEPVAITCDEMDLNNDNMLYGEYINKNKLETSHIKIEQDGDMKYYICTACDKQFHARSQVAYHAYCNGQQKPYHCLECKKSFATHSHYKYHMRVHRNERTYACDACGDSFFQMSKLQRHKLKHTKEKKYSCLLCNKRFNNLTALRKHGLTHTEERPFECDPCGRRFRDKSNYKKHIAKHDAEKKCSCVVCDRECVARRARARELVARRQHQCPRCPQAFHSSKDMRRHQQVHTDSKPFRCKVCNRRFRRKDNLDRHIRNTHPDHAPSAAAECDDTPPTNGHTHKTDRVYETQEKSKLEILNPLPPLPQEVMQKHMTTDDDKKGTEAPVLDKSYILEANNARQSVIVSKCIERKDSRPESEYVHKILKANSMRIQKDVALPPIDEKKLIELETNTSLNNLDVGPLPKDLQRYKNILYDKEKEMKSEEDKLESKSPEMHWRRKMQLNINW